MIVAEWNDECWEIRSISCRGRAPEFCTEDYIVFSKSEDAVKEILLKRKQPICRGDIRKIGKNSNVCYIEL